MANILLTPTAVTREALRILQEERPTIMFMVPTMFQLVSEQPGFDDANWETIPVPANVEKFGHGIPIYVNITYPWRKPWNPPLVPEDPPAPKEPPLV